MKNTNAQQAFKAAIAASLSFVKHESNVTITSVSNSVRRRALRAGSAEEVMSAQSGDRQLASSSSIDIQFEVQVSVLWECEYLFVRLLTHPSNR